MPFKFTGLYGPRHSSVETERIESLRFLADKSCRNCAVKMMVSISSLGFGMGGDDIPIVLSENAFKYFGFV